MWTSRPITVAGSGVRQEPIERVVGRTCDDVIGLFTEFRPKFVRRYAEVAQSIETAVREYAADVRARRFPAAEHTFGEDRR